MSKGWTTIKSMIDVIDEALASMQTSTYGVLYETLCREKAMLLFEAQKKEEAIAYLTESFGASVRQKFITTENQSRVSIDLNSKKTCKDQAKSRKKSRVVKGLQVRLVEFQESLDPDGPLGFKTRLASLPSEWTVVQISQMDCGNNLCAPHSIPGECNNTKPLMITRLGCGSRSKSMDVQFVPKPWPLPCSKKEDLIAELQDIILTNTTTKKFGNATEFWKEKKEIDNRFETVLEALRDWMSEYRCWLLGRIVNPGLEAEVDNAVNKLAKKLNILDDNKTALNILINGSAYLTDQELIRGLDRLIPTANDVVRKKHLQDTCDAVRYLARHLVVDDHSTISTVPRHHVILILDKLLYKLPWERLDVIQKQPVSRVPCLTIAHAMHENPQTNRELNADSTFFVVDPDSNLKNCAERLGPVFLSRKAWDGTISKAPSKTLMGQVLKDKDIYLYSGHGAGMQLLPDNLLCNSVAILIGCSSSSIDRFGTHWELHGAPINLLLSGSPAVLGMLWSVLDRDADRMTLQLIEKWLPPDSKKDSTDYRKQLRFLDASFAQLSLNNVKPCNDLFSALWFARDAAHSKFLAAAFIANGLPMRVEELNNKK